MTHDALTEAPSRSFPTTRWFRVFVALGVALLGAAVASAVAGASIERAWSQRMGFGNSFDSRLVWSLCMWAGSILLSVGAPALCLLRVRRLARAVFGKSGLIRPSLVTPLVVAVGFVVAPLLGSRSETAMLAVAGWRERITGPNALGVEPGFYVFRLPLLDAVSSWGVALSAACLTVTAAAAIGAGLVYRTDRGLEAATPVVLRLLVVPFVALTFSVAMRLWLARYDMASRANGELVGIFGLQRSWVVPMLSVLALGSIAIGAAVIPIARRGRGVHHATFDLWDELLLARVGVMVWLVAAIVGAVLIPAAAQSAEPFPEASEVSPLLNHFASTINSYGVEEVLRQVRDDAPDPTGGTRPGPATLMSAVLSMQQPRPLDPKWPIQASLERSVALTGLTGAANDGEVAAAVSEGSIGISMRAGWRRLMAAIRFGDLGMLTSEAIGSETVLVHHRTPVERAHAIAPFLRFSSEPYLLEHAGRRVWVVDGFTTANTFPGAQRFSIEASNPAMPGRQLVGAQLNYVRASVKALVDAQTGATKLYRVDVADPIARAWSRALPGLLRTVDRLEVDYPGIAAQFRYPQDLLAFQAAAIGAYHSARPEDLVDVTSRWSASDLARPGAVSPVLDVPYAVAGDAIAMRSAVRVLEPVVAQPAARYVLVGRVNAQGAPRLFIDKVEGPRSLDVATEIEKSKGLETLRTELARSKREVLIGDLVPIPSQRYGLLYSVVMRSIDERKVVRTEAVVLGGPEGVAVGTDPNDVFGRYLALRGASGRASGTPTTVPAGDLARLQGDLAENRRRLAESEAEVEELRRRVSVLESSRSPVQSTSPDGPASSAPTTLVRSSVDQLLPNTQR